MRNTVEQIRRKRRSEQAARERQEAQATVKNFGDRINPDAAKDPKAAAAEEAVIGLLLMFEEYRNAVEKGEIPLSEADFVTEFHRRVFVSIMRRHASESGLHFELMGEEFDPDEMGRIQKMEVTRRQLSQNGPEIFRSAVAVLRGIRQDRQVSDMDLNTRLAYLREKKMKKNETT